MDEKLVNFIYPTVVFVDKDMEQWLIFWDEKLVNFIYPTVVFVDKDMEQWLIFW